MNSRRTMYVILTLVTLTFAGFAVAQTTYGQGTSNPGSTNTVTGTVISFEPGKLVVATNAGERTFVVDSATVRPETVTVNLPVLVQFASESGGDRAVRVTENTQQSAAGQTPGGSTTGNDSWPGAANQDDDVNANTGDRADAGTTGTTMTDTTTGTTGSMTGTTDTTGSMNTTGSTYGSTGSTTGSMDTATGTTDTTTGSTYAGTADQTAERETGGIDSSGYQDQDTLPATGSELPLVGLLGLLAFGGAALLRLTR